MQRRLMLLGVGLIVGWCASPSSAQKTTTFSLDGAQKVRYKQVGEHELHLHVYKPPQWRADDRRAAIVFFFGGGWVGGTPAQFSPQCEHLAARGMVAITAEYRVRSRHGAHPADCVADGKDAVRWVRAHAAEWGIDGARLAVAGGSAGGHVAASTATLPPLPEDSDDPTSCRPNALILYNPVCDTSPLGYGNKRLAGRAVELSPVHHIRPHMASTLLFHGDADTTVPHENAQRFQQLMRDAGNACELVTYPGAKHGFFNRGRPQSQYEDTTRRLDAFLTQLGFLPPSSPEIAVAGRTLSQWRQELASANLTKRRRAAQSVGQFGALAADTFLQMLDDEDAAVRYLGASHVGDHAAPGHAQEKLVGLLQGNSRGVRLAAAYALCRLGDADRGLAVLAEGLEVQERGAVCSAAEFIGRLGSLAASLDDVLTSQMSEQSDYHTRGAMANAQRLIRDDRSLVAHRRPTGGGEPRGWKPSERPAPASAKADSAKADSAKADFASADRRPNILWISCEDISPNLRCYGDAYARTPHLDRLAREGARFDRAFTPAGVCAVMRSGHITGVYPISQGSHHMRSQIVLPLGVKCFPEYLRAAGYFCTNNAKTDYQFAPPKTVWDRQGAGHADWRERAPGQPFFSVINLTCSHESQIRHGERTHDAILARLSPDQRHDPDLARMFLPPIHRQTAESRKDWAWYADNISEMDRQAGMILEQLAADGLADNTIVVFWGDHGRGLPRAKRWIYDSGIHVPFIVRWPGHVQPSTARPDLVSTQDLAPTMLAIAGVPVPPHMQGRIILGPQRQEEPEFLFFHRDRMDEAYELMRAARDRDFKYIRNYQVGQTYAQNIDYMNKMPTLVDLRQGHAEGQLSPAQARFFRHGKPPEELYDLRRDPHETVNLAWLPEFAPRVKRMRDALETWQEQVTDLGMVPEPVMMEQMRPTDEVEQAGSPEFAFSAQGGEVEVAIQAATPGASITYRTGRGGWQLYVEPLQVASGTKVEAIACRAGFRDSAPTQVTVPALD